MKLQKNWEGLVNSSGFVLKSPAIVVNIISGMSLVLKEAHVSNVSCHKDPWSVLLAEDLM